MKNSRYGLLCFIPSIVLFLFYDFLPERIATHFNVYGNVDIVSSRWYIIVFVPLLGYVGHIVYMYILEKKPDWEKKTGKIFTFICSFFNMASYSFYGFQ